MISRIPRLASIMILLAYAPLSSPASGAEVAERPNVIVVMTDNQGYGDLGAYGGLRAPTPRIDRLTSEGVQFLDFQVEPNCTPSRAAFMTGRMPIRSGTSGLVFPGEPGGLHPMEVTIAEVMKTAGYETAYYGKWHLGETAEREPQMQGFDEFYGILNTSFPVDPNFPGMDLEVIESQKVLRGTAGKPAEVVREMDLEYRAFVDRELSEMSAKYIEEKAAAKKPFFLLTSYINPHHPVVAHPDFVGKSGGGAYPDVLMEIDHNTGIILDAVDKAGIRDNTIFIFFSDNGPTRYSLTPEENGDSGPWSGELGSAWEGGLRTIGIMRWPGRIREDWKTAEMVHLMDFFPTLGSIVGANLPTDRPIDGVDQTDFLLGKQENSARDSRAVIFNGKLTVMRWRQFKLHFLEYERHRSLARPSHEGASIPSLYNLRSDPKELYNIIGQRGGTNVAAHMLKMAGQLRASFKEHPHTDYSNMTREK
ncbi:MAG: sulfatase-like hydrolase/transferase [Alphaproteobacteria bacterium]